MAPFPLATWTVALFAGALEWVATLSVLEIGPNLLAAITSIIGAVVLIVQIQVARSVRDTREVVKENHRELTEAVGHSGRQDNRMTGQDSRMTGQDTRMERMENGE